MSASGPRSCRIPAESLASDLESGTCPDSVRIRRSMYTHRAGMPSTSSVARNHPSLQAPYWDAELRRGTFTFSCLLNLAVPSGEPEARRTCILSSVIAVQRRKSLFSIAIVANCVKLMLLIFPLRRLRDSSGEHRADDVAEGKSASPPVRPGLPVLALSIPGLGM